MKTINHCLSVKLVSWLASKFFNCQYPILAVAMNRVSDIDFAIETSKAGAYASVSLFNYLIDANNIDFQWFKNDLDKFQTEFGHCNFVLSLDSKNLNLPTSKLIKHYNISHLEIILDGSIDTNIINDLKSSGIKILIKVTNLLNIKLKSYVDALILKGSESAGTVGGLSLIDQVKLCKILFPSIPIIASGGIGNNTRVKELLNMGVAAVGIGTLFAATKESCLSDEAKQRLIKMKNVSKIGKQNAIVFSEMPNDDENHTKGLIAGIKTGMKGHIFAGQGIANIEEILPIKSVIDKLMLDKDYNFV